MKTFSQWAASVANRYIDVDGVSGAQCWDLAAHYLSNVVKDGAVLWTQYGDRPGYASGIWGSYDRVPAMRDVLTKVLPSEPTQAGDIAIWAYGSPDYPLSHVAVSVADAGNNIYALSQNSTTSKGNNPYPNQSTGPTVYQYLTKRGLLGYLRPNNNFYQSSNTTIIEDSEMPILNETSRTEPFNLDKGQWTLLPIENDSSAITIIGGGSATYFTTTVSLNIQGLPEGAELHVRFVIDDFDSGKRHKQYRTHEIIGTSGGAYSQLTQIGELQEIPHRVRVEVLAFVEGVVINGWSSSTLSWK